MRSTLADNVKVTAIPLDLNRDLEAALDGAIDLVTTSAFLDLVSKGLARPADDRNRRTLDPVLRRIDL